MRANLFTYRALVLATLFLFASSAHAATLSLTNSSGTVGQTMSVSVLVSAQGGESLNGVSTRVEFPTDKLTLLSLSKAGSVITFWAEEPSFSNSAGTASLEGIIPNPGYSGQGGRVITLVFQVKAPGTATLSFSNASVLANDGRGTNILTSASPRTLFLAASPAPAPAPAPTPAPPPVRTTRPAPDDRPDDERPAPIATTSGKAVATTAPAAGTDMPHDPSPYPVPSHVARALVLLLAAVGFSALLLAGYFMASRMLEKRRKLLRSGDIVHRSFSLLKKDLASHLAELKRLPDSSLTDKEIGFLDQFEKDLEDVETIVKSKLKKK